MRKNSLRNPRGKNDRSLVIRREGSRTGLRITSNSSRGLKGEVATFNLLRPTGEVKDFRELIGYLEFQDPEKLCSYAGLVPSLDPLGK